MEILDYESFNKLSKEDLERYIDSLIREYKQHKVERKIMQKLFAEILSDGNKDSTNVKSKTIMPISEDTVNDFLINLHLWRKSMNGLIEILEKFPKR